MRTPRTAHCRHPWHEAAEHGASDGYQCCPGCGMTADEWWLQSPEEIRRAG